MIRITNVYQRPNTDVPFHNVNMTQELFEHVKTTYKDTGKAVSVSVTKSDDLLTMTAIWVWNTPEDYTEYQADPLVKEWITATKNHNSINEITHISKLIENI
jgi:hypothetical protein